MASTDARSGADLTYASLGVALATVSHEEEQAALRAAFAALASPGGGVDALGAPIESWDDLRRGVKEVVRSVGMVEVARRYGATPGTLRDMIERREGPGRGARARLAWLVKTTRDRDRGNFHLSNPRA